MTDEVVSESLLEDAPTPQPKSVNQLVEAPRENTTREQNDYLFKNDLGREAPDSELNNAMRDRSRWSFENDEAFKELRLRDRFNTTLTTVLNERAALHRRRHFSLDGRVIVYCRVRNKWPRLDVVPLTVPLQVERKVPKLEVNEQRNEKLLRVVFRPLTVGLRRAFHPYVYETRIMNNVPQAFQNNDELARLCFIHCFESWNLPVELETQNRRLTDEACDVLRKQLHPRLVDVVAREFLRLNELSEQEQKLLKSQCGSLFDEKSNGVDNPTEGVRLYCEAATFAKEFGLSGKALDELPYRVAALVRYVVSQENEIRQRELKEREQKQRSQSSSKPQGPASARRMR